ncbi:MAG: tyrosine-type recombinase/integrase [Betaproteobacteria bacterium]|nr:tyrosine-type recombinase/integrase [Betaproteobacteria bacterium]
MVKAPRLAPANAAAIWRAVTAELPATAMLGFCLLTGCRVGEARALRREDVDLEAATATFRQTKAGNDFTVCLSTQAVELLRPLLRRKTGLVFSGDGRGGLSRVRAATGLQFGFHDLRKLFAQVAVEVGVPHAVLVGMLNHSVAGSVTLSHYAKPSPAALRAGWAAVAEFITG